jgi:hypothetical protein
MISSFSPLGKRKEAACPPYALFITLDIGRR